MDVTAHFQQLYTFVYLDRFIDHGKAHQLMV